MKLMPEAASSSSDIFMNLMLAISCWNFLSFCYQELISLTIPSLKTWLERMGVWDGNVNTSFRNLFDIQLQLILSRII